MTTVGHLDRLGEQALVARRVSTIATSSASILASA